MHPSKLSLDQRMEHPVSILANFLTYMLPANNKPFFPSSTLILIMSYKNSVSIVIEISAGQLQRLIPLTLRLLMSYIYIWSTHS